MGKPCMSLALQDKLIHVKCCAREPLALYLNSMGIVGWLLSTRAQNIPFKRTWLLKKVIILSILTLEHILCLLLPFIYWAVYLLNRDLCELKAGILLPPPPPPPPPAGEWLWYETISRWSLTAVWLNWTNGLLRLLNNMVTELVRPVNYNPGISQKLIKLEISSCRCSQLECNGECDETEGYSALYTPLLLLSVSRYSTWVMPKRWYLFLKKGWKPILFMFWNICLLW